VSKPPKALKEYLHPDPEWWESRLEDYQNSPAVAFLREAVHIADAINLCRRSFTRKTDRSLNKDGQDSAYRLTAAAFSSMMSHFEVYQRSLFAGMFETTRLQPDFRLADCVKYLQRDLSLTLDINRLLAYRGRAASVGHLIADSLSGWHNPERVNAHFRSLLHDYEFFGGKEVTTLLTLWQLRHSIVHTGGWLTHADAQKVPLLLSFADKPILLDETFVDAIARRLHGIVFRSTTGASSKFIPKLSAAVTAQERKAAEALFKVTSRRSSWLKTAA
jgi:hypothetical protein